MPDMKKAARHNPKAAFFLILVGLTGFEPATPTMSKRPLYSSNLLISQHLHQVLSVFFLALRG
jgi:hypothetical protein